MSRDLVHSFVAADTNKPNLSQLIKSEDYSSTHCLYRVTALALKFVHEVRNRIRNPIPESSIAHKQEEESGSRRGGGRV